MSVESGNAPSWLFSFVDLAFLSMIAMTQLSSNISEPAPDLGEMVVPRIGAETAQPLATGASDLWQLRVHPPSDEGFAPFELIHVVGARVEGEGERLDREALREALSGLEERSGRKPLLAPHEDSRSQDMLEAAALIEEHWPTRRRALIAKTFEGQ